MIKDFRTVLFLLVLVTGLLLLSGCLTQTVINPNGGGEISLVFPLTPDEVKSGAQKACSDLRLDPRFTAAIQQNGDQTWCHQLAHFTDPNDLRQVYSKMNGVTINKLEIQGGRFIYDIRLNPSSRAQVWWQVKMPGSITNHNASVVDGQTLKWEGNSNCGNTRLYAESLIGNSLSATEPTSASEENAELRGQSDLQILAVRDLGSLGQPLSVLGRDVGASGRVGRCSLWVFGDTIFTPKSVDGMNLRSSTAGWANPEVPFQLNEPLDTNGAPFEFLPFTNEERAYNQNPNYPHERYALWPSSVIAAGDGSALVFYGKVKVHPGVWNYEDIGVGVARIPLGEKQAVRDSDLLFSSTEPSFAKAMAYDSHVYLYGCEVEGFFSFSCYVARAPLARARDRSAYEFWNGAAWGTDVKQAQPVLRDSFHGMSVSWNPYIRKFLTVNSDFSNRVLIHTSPRPEGPWSTSVVAFTGLPTPEGQINYSAIEHPELAADGGRKLVISYYHPIRVFKGEIRLVEVTLQ